MSNSQYAVRVEVKDGTELTLRVFTIAEETPAPPDVRDVDLLVRFLCDERPPLFRVRKKKRGRKEQPPMLLGRIDGDGGDIFDDDWLFENAARYISAVDEVEKSRGSHKQLANGWDPKDTRQHATLPQVVFRLVLTDEQFAAHLEVGDIWDSCAYPSELWATKKPSTKRR